MKTCFTITQVSVLFFRNGRDRALQLAQLTVTAWSRVPRGAGYRTTLYVSTFVDQLDEQQVNFCCIKPLRLGFHLKHYILTNKSIAMFQEQFHVLGQLRTKMRQRSLPCWSLMQTGSQV